MNRSDFNDIKFLSKYFQLHKRPNYAYISANTGLKGGMIGDNIYCMSCLEFHEAGFCPNDPVLLALLPTAYPTSSLPSNTIIDMPLSKPIPPTFEMPETVKSAWYKSTTKNIIIGGKAVVQYGGELMKYENQKLDYNLSKHVKHSAIIAGIVIAEIKEEGRKTRESIDKHRTVTDKLVVSSDNATYTARQISEEWMGCGTVACCIFVVGCVLVILAFEGVY